MRKELHTPASDVLAPSLNLTLLALDFQDGTTIGGSSLPPLFPPWVLGRHGSLFICCQPLFDPPKHDSVETIRRALNLGVNVKMITGVAAENRSCCRNKMFKTAD